MGQHCTHRELTKVMMIGSCEMWAGSQSQAKAGAKRMDLVISLLNEERRGGGAGRFRIARGSGKLLGTLAQYQRQRQAFLSIDWPDMSVPELDKDFWLALYEDLKRLKGRALIYCMGGHGRTGTTLAILAHLSGACGTADPLQWVRDTYCQDAVETRSQIDYLVHEIGLTTAQSGTKSSGYSNGSDRFDDDVPKGQQRSIIAGFDFGSKLRR
jgi:hypothetical protein